MGAASEVVWRSKWRPLSLKSHFEAQGGRIWGYIIKQKLLSAPDLGGPGEVKIVKMTSQVVLRSKLRLCYWYGMHFYTVGLGTLKAGMNDLCHVGEVLR